MKEYHKLSGLKNRNFKSKIRVSAWLGSVERPLPGWQMPSSFCVLTQGRERGWGGREGREGGKAEREGRKEKGDFCLFLYGHSPMILELHPMTSFTLNFLLKM